MFFKDGKTWSKVIAGEEGEHINRMIFVSKQFVGVGLGGTYFFSKWLELETGQK
ncbi:MAG: hypothetical protein MK132_22460 [Lentisphaerales bacterium]|nr:hypothetical protein [Lentisphaerales bacterium]